MTADRILVITGTSRGIGRYLAEHYAGLGWSVVGCSRKDNDLSIDGYRHYPVDITDEDAVVEWISSVHHEFGWIDALINNAGSASMNHVLLTPGSTVDRLFNLNFKGTFLVSREVAKVMHQEKNGRIINFSSIATSLALEGEAVYASSKAAVVTYSRVLARELASMNITVNVISPSVVQTDLVKGVPKEKLKKLLERMAISRYSTLGDVSNVTDFFLSPESSMITGQVITIGGW